MTDGVEKLLAAACACGDWTEPAVLAAVAAPEWQSAERMHDWRSHVPECIQENWAALSGDARLAVFVIAKTAADNENWDLV